MKLWLCGQLIGEFNQEGRSLWDFQGVFSDEAKADKACVDENYFIYSVVLDEEFPKEPIVPTEYRYPRRGQ